MTTRPQLQPQPQPLPLPLPRRRGRQAVTAIGERHRRRSSTQRRESGPISGDKVMSMEFVDSAAAFATI